MCGLDKRRVLRLDLFFFTFFVFFCVSCWSGSRFTISITPPTTANTGPEAGKKSGKPKLKGLYPPMPRRTGLNLPAGTNRSSPFSGRLNPSVLSPSSPSSNRLHMIGMSPASICSAICAAIVRARTYNPISPRPCFCQKAPCAIMLAASSKNWMWMTAPRPPCSRCALALLINV